MINRAFRAGDWTVVVPQRPIQWYPRRVSLLQMFDIANRARFGLYKDKWMVASTRVGIQIDTLRKFCVANRAQ